MSTALDVLGSSLSSTMRFWRGTSSKPALHQPELLLELYDMESCPYCRLVREALTELDLDAMIYSCPKGGKRFRPALESLGGKIQVPFLVDKNTGKSLYESKDIIDYLYATYGGRSAPLSLRALDVAGAVSASVVRVLQTSKVKPSNEPSLPLILYSFESSPFARRVRELLCSLELPYELRNTGKAMLQDMGPPALRKALFPDLPVKGRNRLDLLERTGKVQVPYLVDPNTGQAMYESDDIKDYLLATYGR